MVVVGFWLPVTLNILFNLVKSVSIVLSGHFFFIRTPAIYVVTVMLLLWHLLLKNSCCCKVFWYQRR